MNNRYTLTLKDPILRPGLSISTEVSGPYVSAAALVLMEYARTTNALQEQLDKLNSGEQSEPTPPPAQ